MSSTYREIALTLYRWATGFERSRLAQSFCREQWFPACILFYHRVSNHSMNGWSIPVSNFVCQLEWLQRHVCPASLDDIRSTQLLGTRSKPMVGVTFDDGYAENCQHAIPLLLERRIPVTYFVSTHFVETGEPFPHDLSAGTPLRPNTIREIQTMADQGIQIGAHSHTHIDFGKPLSEQSLRSEIVDVRKKLQDWSGQPVDYFAFPFGHQENISQQAIDCVFNAGYKCFLSAAGGFNWPGQDANHLHRIHGDPGFAAFKNWLTFDPRKIRSKSQIEYSQPEINSMRCGSELVGTNG
ncbi:MAG: polysaccharide deacetylase family protein [Pirellula sp.]